jgi:hypothetical protein
MAGLFIIKLTGPQIAVLTKAQFVNVAGIILG